MRCYTTCRDCGTILHVTNNETVHPGCTPKPTKYERLVEKYLRSINDGDQENEDRLREKIDTLTMEPPNMLAAALAYAAWGWPVFPLRTGEKRPATSNGFKAATTDTDRITAWWTTHPHNNIGLPTGHNFDVIDIDTPDGPHSMNTLLGLRKHNDRGIDTGESALPDCHGWVMTPRGGSHLYIPPIGDRNGTGILPGIDYRGLGGYVVAPPSHLGTPVKCWRWTMKPSPALIHSKTRTRHG